MNTMTTYRTEDLYDIAELRLTELGLGYEQIEFCLTDWPEGDDHLSWLIAAPLEEIISWGESADWGR